MLCIGRSPFPNVERIYPVSQVSLSEDRQEPAGEWSGRGKKAWSGRVLSLLKQALQATLVGAGLPANTGKAGAMHRVVLFAGKPAPTGAVAHA
ncbi:Sensory box protein/GGDEF family protein (modular protein) [Pseudomonas sp. JV551A1]|uniref:Sensory box protein/GGDEF family protein (Modular protein) n=1 Tax=Pseudomonas inefficax TaxID=2078786 RepID=A0AAQ1P3I1_9PSED|nr:Sensory box protein/GGDEF family protein (modular protein) [Pseudomonas sp. JV551A1]SPO59105.1 Sensory box protein/GGDEF family protein (modular protein) [Pseudomonas inefficax]